MKLMIGVPTPEQARFAVFYDYLDGLSKPEGTLIARAHSSSAAWNRNLIVEQALQEDCTHVLFIDDDQAFAPDALQRLLRHDKDIVSGLYFGRVWPHCPVIFDSVGAEGSAVIRYPQGKGLIKIGACGFGFCLINTRVFKGMEKPWIRHGELKPDKRNEDTGFCRRATALGFEVYCDLTCVIGHLATVIVWPNFQDGKWHVTYDTNGSQVVTVPMIAPVSKVDTGGVLMDAD